MLPGSLIGVCPAEDDATGAVSPRSLVLEGTLARPIRSRLEEESEVEGTEVSGGGGPSLFIVAE